MMFLWLIVGHFLGDFPAQSAWMAAEKGKSWEVLIYHALVYTAVVFLVASFGGYTLSYLALYIILSTHILFDAMKARWKLIPTIWLDQILHIGILLFIALVPSVITLASPVL